MIMQLHDGLLNIVPTYSQIFEKHCLFLGKSRENFAGFFNIYPPSTVSISLYQFLSFTFFVSLSLYRFLCIAYSVSHSLYHYFLFIAFSVSLSLYHLLCITFSESLSLYHFLCITFSVSLSLYFPQPISFLSGILSTNRKFIYSLSITKHCMYISLGNFC